MLSPEEIKKIAVNPETHWIPAWKWVTGERKPVCSGHNINILGPFAYGNMSRDEIRIKAGGITYTPGMLIIPDEFDDRYQAGFASIRIFGTPCLRVLCSKGIHSQPAPRSENFQRFDRINIRLAIPVEFTLAGGHVESPDGEKYRSACAWVLGEDSLCF